MVVLNKCMDAAAELGRNPVSKHQIQPEYGGEQADVERLPNPSRETKFSGANVEGKYSFSCSVDHEQDWQLYLVDPYSCYICDHTEARFAFQQELIAPTIKL